MYSDYYESLIHKRLSGELSQDEERALNEWLKESPDHRGHFEEAERIWKLTGIDDGDVLDIDLEHELARFNERIQQEPAATLPVKRLRLVWRYAAAAVVLIGVALFWAQSGADDGALMLVETGANETREVTLPDNSTVLLNENSRISYTADFSERFIQMNGEIFFDVQHDATRPFRIQSGKSMTHVLGTSFVVRYRANEPDIRVTVSTGRVTFGVPETNQEEVLEPGYQGRLLKATNTLSVAPNDNPNYQVWRNRSLSFESTSLSDVVQQLRIHFGIVIEDPAAALGACTFTADFDAPDLEEVLQLLSYSIDIDISVQNGVYEFSGIGCMQ